MIEIQGLDVTTALAESFGPFEDLRALAADASTRRFYRGRLPGGSTRVYVHDASANGRDLERMVAARELFDAIRVRVPEIYRHDATLCILEMEDMGDRLLAEALEGMSRGETLHAYAQAGAMAARIALGGGALLGKYPRLSKPVLGRERMRTELAFFVVHDVVGRRGVRDAGLLRDLSRVLDRLTDRLDQPDKVFAHRDFHARNLMILDDGSLAALDFQDALLAPPFYDLASLLFDPYVSLDQKLREESSAAYTGVIGQSLAAMDNPLLSYMALERLLKALGTYSFQTLRQRKSHFAPYIAVAERRVLRVANALSSEMSSALVDLLGRVGFAPTKP